MDTKLVDNNLNFIIQLSPIDYLGDTQIKLDFYLPNINRRQFDALSIFLGKTYELIKDEKVNPDVFVVDWENYLRKSLGELAFLEELKKFEAFVERTLLTAEIYCYNTNEFYNYLEDQEKLKSLGLNLENIKNELKGFILFICALFRYIRGQERKSVLGLFITSLALSEWKGLHKKSMQGQKTQEKKRSKASMEKI